MPAESSSNAHDRPAPAPAAVAQRRPVRHLLHGLGGFGGSVVVNGLISLAVIPIVVLSAGTALWAGVAIAQAVGSFICVVVSFGWAVTGPATTAGLPVSDRGHYFAGSLTSRAWLAMAALPVLVLTALFADHGDPLADVCAALALALPALGASWFFVGERAPLRLLVLDTTPRAIGTAIGAALLLGAHAPLAAFTGLQAAGAAAAVLIGSGSVLRRFGVRAALAPRQDLRRLAGQSSGVVAAITAAVYVNLPVVVTGLVVPQQTAVYALVDKLQKLCLTALGPVFQVSQGTVGGAPPHERAARARTTARAAVVLGTAVAIGFSALGLLGARILTHGVVMPPLALVVALGIALGAVATSAVTGLSCLTALGAVRAVAVSTVLGAVLGIPAIIAAGSLFGVIGIGFAVAFSEVAVTVYQLVVLHRRLGASLPRRGVTPLLGSPTF